MVGGSRHAPKIFVSYRRSDSEYAAGGLARELRRRFGEDQIFRDKEDFGAGLSWKNEVSAQLGPGAAVLVLIGVGWARPVEPGGPGRLEDPNDAVRLELERALSSGAKIFPVLLENARVPADSDLPAHLRTIVDLTALRFRDSDWSTDVDAIARTLVKAGFRLDDATIPAPRRFPRKIAWAMGCLALALVALSISPKNLQDLYVTPAMSATALLLAILGWRDSTVAGRSVRWLISGTTLLSALVLLTGIGRGLWMSQEHRLPVGSVPSPTEDDVAENGGGAEPLGAHAPIPSAVRPEPSLRPSSLAGKWRDDSGIEMNVEVRGNSFSVNAFGRNGYRSSGEGQVFGRNVTWKFQTNLPSSGFGHGILSADGLRIDGEFEDSRMGHQRESFFKM